MLYLTEFEICESEDGFSLAFPFGYEGGTQGKTFSEALEMAADWLKTVVEFSLCRGESIPGPTLGNEPMRGGKIVLIGVCTSIEQIAKVQASDAARELGVSPARVSQMLAGNQLEGFRVGHKSYITRASLDAQLARERRAGRPRREAVHA